MARVSGRTLAAYAAVLMLPLVLFAALQAAFSMREMRSQIEADSLGRTREINAAIDGQLLADQSALQVLSTSHSIVAHDWKAAEQRVEVVQRSRPSWRSVDLTDVEAGREIWETRSGTRSNLAMRPWIAAYLSASDAARSNFTGIEGGPPDCPCVAIHVPVLESGKVRYILTAELAPQAFQSILLAHAPAGSTSAVVDAKGTFIARTIDYPAKLGTPATHFVREAIAKGTHGLYPGVTYEGVRNYSAFERSPLTGWSTHIALKEDLLTRPRLGSIFLTGVAGLAALLLALGIAAFAYRQNTNRRLEEARSAQSQKLAAVGQLASGIAHDFNNLLMIITNSLTRISDKEGDPDLQRHIDNASIAAERGTMLIQQLLAFTRSKPLDIGPVDLHALLGNLRGIIQQSVGKNVVVTIDIGDDARWVTSNASQLEMALVNLAVNARDAMPSGGSLTLRSSPSKQRAECVDLDVFDTGEGMPNDVIDRAMEPFFTTKPLGKGTGLGLAQVFGVISQSGGTVEIQSELGKGTTITLRFKRADDCNRVSATLEGAGASGVDPAPETAGPSV